MEVAAVALIGATLAPAHAATESKRTAAKPRKVTSEVTTAPSLRPGALGSFTPAITDKARGGTPGRVQTVERSIRFTPSGKPADRKTLALGVTTRTMTPVDNGRGIGAVAVPSGYNLGLSVGYLGFSLSGGYSKVDSGLGGHREGVDLGLTYRGKRWKTSLQASADTPSGLDPLMLDKRYSVELGGAYAITPRLSLQGGMRYQLSDPIRDSLHLGDRHDDGTIYLGTALSF